MIILGDKIVPYEEYFFISDLNEIKNTKRQILHLYFFMMMSY